MYQPSTLSPPLLTKALLRAVEQLGLAAGLPSLLNSSPEEIAQLQSGARSLDPQRPEWEAALKIVGMFRATVEVLGSAERARVWLATPNEALGGRPFDLLATVAADRVHRYLSSVRKYELRMPPGTRHPNRSEH
ncbi:MAG TPA: MbcA/ParS/Xre antitoxin family protein [Steroidobacter sp.]|uniref:MbcA/ParS/Xre antitoxin family protein n=1 Tax=Steroidobacter sp. TaxID=1978227 RepID=UPI002ED89D0E